MFTNVAAYVRAIEDQTRDKSAPVLFDRSLEVRLTAHVLFLLILFTSFV